MFFARNSFYKRSSTRKYSVILLVLSKIWEHVSSERNSTRREVFYQNVANFVGQRDVDMAVATISGTDKRQTYL